MTRENPHGLWTLDDIVDENLAAKEQGDLADAARKGDDPDAEAHHRRRERSHYRRAARIAFDIREALVSDMFARASREALQSKTTEAPDTVAQPFGAQIIVIPNAGVLES